MTRYFDDVTVGDTFESQGSEDITREDILSFAQSLGSTGLPHR